MVTKICVGNYVGDIYHRAKFCPNRFRGFGSAHAWFRRLHTWWRGWSRDSPWMTTVQGQKVKGQGHKVTHKKFTQSRALALVTTTVQGQKVKGQGHQVTWRVSRQKRCHSAVDGHINFKLDGNYQRGGRRVWYTFLVSKSNKPEVEIWRTFRI